MKIIIPWPAIKTVIMYAIKSNLTVKKRTLASYAMLITIVSDTGLLRNTIFLWITQCTIFGML